MAGAFLKPNGISRKPVSAEVGSKRCLVLALIGDRYLPVAGIGVRRRKDGGATKRVSAVVNAGKLTCAGEGLIVKTSVVHAQS